MNISVKEYRRACIRKIVEGLNDEQEKEVKEWKKTHQNAEEKIAFIFFVSLYLNKQKN